jgi:trk system potassium uptake protein TrkH
MQPGNLIQNLTDSIFESTSGFTTTGFSVIPDISALPQSIILYRSLTQFIGGIGIVLVLLAFFYPDAKLQEFARSMGFSKNNKVKKTFMLIISVYCTLTIALISAGLIFGYRDIVNLASFVFSAISTGGFSPVADITQMATTPPLNYIIIIGMIFGACNFLVLAGLFKKKLGAFFNSEISAFFILAIVSISLVTYFFKVPLYDSVFHVLSAMTTTGFSYLSVSAFPDAFKLSLVALMLIGGASFSTAGGIKIFRFVLLLKATKKAVVEAVTEKEDNVKLFGKEYTNADILRAAILVLLAIAIVFVSSLVVSYYGFKPIDSLFETTSALATTGLSVGIVGPSLALELKWLFSFLMLLGRVEIFAFLIMFCKEKAPNHQQFSRGHSKKSRRNNRNGKNGSEKTEKATVVLPQEEVPENAFTSTDSLGLP